MNCGGFSPGVSLVIGTFEASRFGGFVPDGDDGTDDAGDSTAGSLREVPEHEVTRSTVAAATSTVTFLNNCCMKSHHFEKSLLDESRRARLGARSGISSECRRTARVRA